MTQEHHALRVGIMALICALFFRIGSLGLWEQLASRLLQPNIASFFIYLETGRRVRFSPSFQAENPDFMESVPASALEEPLPVFSESENLTMKNFSAKRPNLNALLSQPLAWQLRTDQPTVLIFHTHTTESYQPAGEDYQELSPWRTLSQDYNMLSIGTRVATTLEAGGIHVLHDRSLHDYPSYNNAYIDARNTLEDYIARYPSIQLVLDLHRDATDGSSGQLRTLAQVNGTACAQLMLVVGAKHEAYESNLSLATKLHAQLEQDNPGITRPLQLRPQRFNQDLCPGALLVEVGGAGNSHAEALRAADALASAILALAGGANGGPAVPADNGEPLNGQ